MSNWQTGAETGDGRNACRIQVATAGPYPRRTLRIASHMCRPVCRPVCAIHVPDAAEHDSVSARPAASSWSSCHSYGNRRLLTAERVLVLAPGRDGGIDLRGAGIGFARRRVWALTRPARRSCVHLPLPDLHTDP